MTTSFATFGHELYTGKRSYNFVNSKKIWFVIAAVAVALSILVPVAKGGFNLGIEFRGGSEFTVSNVSTTDAALGEKAVHDVVPGAIPRVANVAGNTMRIQTDQLTDDETNRIKDGLTSAYGVTENEVTSNFVGPTWGQDVTRQALIGLVVFVGLAAVLMALYFRTWKMSLSALVGMLVTMFTTAGVYALSDFEVTPSAIIGFLTVLSYSLYDTVVVFDKIRENTADISTSTRRTFSEEVNLAVNQTLVRSINTMMVAILPVAAILFIGAGLLGAGTLRDLSLALFVGILIGTAATIFIAAPLYAWLRQSEPELVKQAKKVAHRRNEAAVQA
ncbi:protein translocase subunit SecF [Paenarthrobacter aurescens]|uniref:Protein-export membrane protein SecF n=1 Tax=Paenarthrobacter aurescens TaxID=43663 RepID=A0A4Y3NC20_PAEAU|nr:protein translocase subunit SecF [Paenarthrobacter aurescens]UKA47983.1 protein translocase subunit SecF [Arthrobacter sp. FW305-123]MDO6143736.1 protein translocase subunit SecF [Paenarthrobacter aurescens]MDO6147584.1 protein translocase subunit SecF [Paenarthrobacter aurescens]MDO6158827.1 protein translocase subunit SecF [Paenarthrobacter aurescens]MDO6162811.1 protein translocase subunit SecF [Paenarthrobacter aurescens]